jgi:hypothetical protein
MSTQPENSEYESDDVEEGEIVSISDEELSMTEDGEEEYQDDDIEDEMDIASLMTSLLATSDGDTVCSALVNLCHQMETQNKILIKMLSKINSTRVA